MDSVTRGVVKELVLVVCLILFAAFGIHHTLNRSSDFAEKCAAKGGYAFYAHGSFLCLQPEAVIKID